jgi:hypothetical protein
MAAIEPSQAVALVPLFRSSSNAMRAFADARESFGAIISLNVEMLCGPGEGTLASRLYDAADLIGFLMDQPDAVFASYSWPGPRRGAGKSAAHPATGDLLRDLSGELAIAMTWADGRSASLLLSDRGPGGPGWERSITLISDAGRMHLDDVSMTWRGSDAAGGGLVDSSRPDAALAGASDPAAALIAREIVRVCEPGYVPEPPDLSRTLAICGAVLLSSRTGEVESPSTILRMAGMG